MQNVRLKRRATIYGSDNHLVVASLKIKLAARKPFANTYVLLDVLWCSIAEYFYELCRILTSP